MYKYLWLVDFISLILLYFLCALPRLKRSARALCIGTLYYVYLSAAFLITLAPVILPLPLLGAQLSHVNIIPFLDISMSRGGALRELLLNILMLVPFGAAMVYIYKKSIAKSVLYGFCFSLSIELSQLFFTAGHHSFDVTDLISNTFGALCGALLCKVLFGALSAIDNRLFKGEHEMFRILKKPTKSDIIVCAVLLAVLIVKSIAAAFI